MKVKHLLMVIGFSFLFALSFFSNPTYGAAYSPYPSHNVSPGEGGGKEEAWKSGRKLVYDVYSGVDGKPKWQITNRDYGRGTQPYLEFTGWSALVGYHEHNASNQETYLWALNKRTGKSYIYQAEMTDLDASKDLEYNRQNSTGEVYNACPKDAYNKSNDECNMYYHNVGFVAHIPLNELFPNGTTEDTWNLRIIKKVENNVVWDYLKVPFQFSDLDFSLGKISLDSGLNAGNLVMANDGVVRRNYPRQTGWSGGRYFTINETYQRVAQNEANTVVWYGVSSPEEAGQTRWAGSAYWIFGGQPAELSYKIGQKTCPDGSIVNLDQTCSIKVDIKHVDAKSNKILREDHHKMKIGSDYSYTPENKGVFKDSQNNPYVAAPLNQQYKGKAPENNLSFTFTYKSSLTDPTRIVEMEGSTEGMAKGDYLWELRRVDPAKPSQIYASSNFEITGKHYSVRNVLNRISTNGVFSEQSDKPMALLLDLKNLQNKHIQYDSSYEYTNHYSENYMCKDQQGSDCFDWVYKDTTAVWSEPYKKVFDLVKHYGENLRLLVDPSFEKMFNVTGAKDLQNITGNGASGEKGGNLIVGKKKAIDMSNDKAKVVFNKNYYERFKQAATSKAKDDNSLPTQSWIDVSPGTMEYEVELPTDSQKSKSFMYQRKNGANSYYYAVDIDKNLRSTYQNQSPYAYTKYALPLQLENMKDKGVVNDTKRSYTLNWTSDYFFVGKQTGFIQPFPYTKYLRDMEQGKGKLPSADEIKNIVNQEAKTNYEQQTGQKFNDTLLHADSNSKEGLYGSRTNLNRYYLPISSDSALKAKQPYENKVLLANMGLNDATLIFGQKFNFERYLVGSVVDDAYVVEQHDPTVEIASYPHQVNVKNDQQPKINAITKAHSAEKLFEFRKTDTLSLYDQLKKVINLGI